jgi:hypothetical protein
MKRTVIWLTEEQNTELAQISKSTAAPVSALVRKAVTRFLEQKRRSRKRKRL